MTIGMRTACSANLCARRVIPAFKSQVPIRQAILIQSVTQSHKLASILPAYSPRVPATTSAREFSAQIRGSPISSAMSDSKRTAPAATIPEASNSTTLSITTNMTENVSDNDRKDIGTPYKNNPPVYEQWRPLISRLVKKIHSAWLSSPRPPPTANVSQINEFMTYWRSIFDKLASEIESDDSLPRYLTTPPASRFEIVLFTQDSGLDCPCCLPWVRANIVLETTEDGVGLTKGDLVRAVGGYLYGFSPTKGSSSGSFSRSKVNIRFNGGEFSQTAGGDMTLPTIYSEYELLTREEYPAYLVKKGDQEWTLQEQLDDRERPLGGWPMGGFGAADKKTNYNESEEVPGKDEKHLVEGLGELKLDAKSKEDRAALGHEVASDSHSQDKEPEQEMAVNKTGEIETSAKREEQNLAANKNHEKEVGSQEDEADSIEGSSDTFEEAPTEYKFPTVIWDTNWLSAGGGGPNGEDIVYGRMPTVWFFCCPPGDFEDRVSTERSKKKIAIWEKADEKEEGETED